MLQVTYLHPNARLCQPREGDVGYDIVATETVTVPAGGISVYVPTGLAIHVPNGYYGRLAERSGLALRHSIGLGGGVIDPSYRGEVGVILFNHHPTIDYVVTEGDRIAQLILEQCCVLPVSVVSSTEFYNTRTLRGTDGFGSTGFSENLHSTYSYDTSHSASDNERKGLGERGKHL